MKLPEEKSAIRLFFELMKQVRHYVWAFSLGCLGNLVYVLVDTGFIKYFEDLIDKGLVKREPHFVLMIPLVVLGYFILRGIGSFSATYFMGYVGRSVVRDFRARMLNHLLFLPTSFHDNHPSGEQISKINFDTEQVSQAISNAVTSTFRGLLFTVSLIILMFTINWRITLLLLTVGPVMLYYIQNISRKMRKHSKSIQDSMGTLTHVGRELIDGQKEIKIFSGQDYENKRIKEVTTENFKQELKLISTIAISVPFMQLIGGCAMVLLLYLAMLPADHPWGTGLTAGEFGAMFMAMMQLMRPIKQIAVVNSETQKGITAAHSIFKFLAEAKEKDLGMKTLSTCQGHIEFDKVTFQYPGLNKPVIADFSATIQPGQTIALVGRSGSGKTTLVSLLARFWEEGMQGDIRVDGHSIQSLSLSNVREHLAVVSQHVTLFDGTVEENIGYGINQQASFEAIKQAAQKANAFEFIERLPHGFKTHIGENGVRLSGGQRQRIAIARALLKNAPILILDEATSALDSESEGKIQEALEQLMKNRTCIVIAHRLSTIEKADQILVVEKGHSVESGTHQELIKKQGIYSKLYKMQYKKEEVFA